ncbi:MAG: quinolinate synthase NadA, partial [Phycisphaerae bacterium]|nr:quinolinate synthase NadA [Phycisphaerae bacterium]
MAVTGSVTRPSVRASYNRRTMLWQPALPERYRQLSEGELASAISARRAELGARLLILGHHYQQDNVVQHADLTGDSLKLSQMAAAEASARGSEFIVFCGVHFMAETADILTDERVKVILPDLSAGCSMADMAAYDDAVEAWECIARATAGTRGSTRARTRVVPITYVNSSAAIKAFVGSKGGACCTSSNAAHVFEWASKGGDQPLAKGESVKILFLPDQHLGRNTAKARGLVSDVDAERSAEQSAGARVRAPKNGAAKNGAAKNGAAKQGARSSEPEMALWSPRKESGGLTDEQIRSAKVILWAGHCSVHKLFRPEHVDQVREEYRDRGGITVLVHPECAQEVVDMADLRGSTEYIINTIHAAPPGSNWAIGTEIHLVNRLARAAAERGVHARILSDSQCLCTTMYRIDQPHLLWVLDNLAEGRVVNQVRVHPEARAHALKALERMLKNAAPARADASGTG